MLAPPVPSSSPSGGGPAISSEGSEGGGSSVPPQAGIINTGSARDSNQIFFIGLDCNPGLPVVNS